MDLFYRKCGFPFPKNELPEIIIDSRQELADFYALAWKLAWDHVFATDKLTFSPFIGEGCNTNRVWIWDSCLMTMFCRYAPDVFPVRNTLDNLYDILSKTNHCPIVIHHPDNPPLFAWAELQLFRHTGDVSRLKEVLPKLVRHYEFLENGEFSGYAHHTPAIEWRKTPEGYCWGGNPSGMDNSPRGCGDHHAIYWVDAPAQQALAAECIEKIAELAGDGPVRSRFLREYEEKKRLLASFWDDETGAFMDRYKQGGFCRVLTPASYWAILAGCGDAAQREAQFSLLTDDCKLGGEIPFPSVSRDDPAFHPEGAYWSGGVWLPVAYMGIKAAEKYEKYDLASRLADQVITYMYRTWQEYEPHTIWECYSPAEHRPSTEKTGVNCRRDFCGWSALGPISLVIENLIGITGLSASEHRIEWHPGISGRIGIRNLPFGKEKISLVLNENELEYQCENPVKLSLNGREVFCRPGTHKQTL